MMVSFTSFANLVLAATVGASPVASVPAAPAFVARTVTVDSTYALTEEGLKNYIAVKKSLRPYWASHKDARTAAAAKGHSAAVTIGQQSMKVEVFDYPELVKHDTAVAGIFTRNKFSAAQFEPTQLSAFQAVGTIAIGGTAASGSTLASNIELAKKHQAELKDAGVVVQTSGGMGMGGMGGNDDLNP